MSSLVHDVPDTVAILAASAVDPLEIAAHLEVEGVSDRVAREQFGCADVFDVGERLWTELPFTETVAERQDEPPAGSVQDLGRGLVYGTPGLLLFALQRTMGWHLEGWVLAVAVSWGWGLGQMTSALTYTARRRGDSAAETVVQGWGLLAAAPTTAAIVGTMVVGTSGRALDVVVAASLTSFMVAAAVMVLHERLVPAALILVPGVLSAAVEVARPSTPDGWVVGGVITTGVLTVAGAWSVVGLPRKGRGATAPGDVAQSLTHLIHGVICGSALALVVMGGSQAPDAHARWAATLPLMLSLGVMEWQLRTFRAGAVGLQDQGSVADYERDTWRLFVRCQVSYAWWTVVLSLLLLWGADLVGAADLALLGLALLLGCVYHLDLTMVSLGRVRAASTSWAVGAVAGLVVALALGAATPLSEKWLTTVGAGVGLVVCEGLLWRRAAPYVTCVALH